MHSFSTAGSGSLNLFEFPESDATSLQALSKPWQSVLVFVIALPLQLVSGLIHHELPQGVARSISVV